MGFLNFKMILRQSSTLFGINNKFPNPVILTLTRSYAMDPDKKRQKAEAKKEQKLAKKQAALAEEPQYFQTRSNKWTELKKRYDEELAAKEKEIIKITLPDGVIIEGFHWDITPLDVAKGISSGLASDAVVAKVNNELWDLERQLESDCKIELLKFDTPDAKAVFWKTAACILGEALERLYGRDAGGLLCNIGSTQTGFFADIHSKNKTINKKNIPEIEEGINKILSGPRVKVERIVASKSDVQELFAYNQLRLPTINDFPGDKIPIYRCGSYIDYSTTPLVRNNKKLNAFKILEVESVLWNAEPVQRIHGVAFPSTNELKNFLKTYK